MGEGGGSRRPPTEGVAGRPGGGEGGSLAPGWRAGAAGGAPWIWASLLDWSLCGEEEERRQEEEGKGRRVAR